MTKKNEYFKVKAKMKAVNKNIAAKHPDWPSQRVYMATRAIVLGEVREALPAVTEETAVIATE